MAYFECAIPYRGIHGKHGDPIQCWVHLDQVERGLDEGSGTILAYQARAMLEYIKVQHERTLHLERELIQRKSNEEKWRPASQYPCGNCERPFYNLYDGLCDDCLREVLDVIRA